MRLFSGVTEQQRVDRLLEACPAIIDQYRSACALAAVARATRGH